MLREIRNIVQRSLARRKRWFQDDDFDLYVWQSPEGRVLEFQLCYERGTSRERALTWKSSVGYANYSVDSGDTDPTERRTPPLIGGGRFGGWRVREKLVDSIAGLEPDVAAFVLGKVADHCDPPRRFPHRGRSAPNWLRRARVAAIKQTVETIR